MARKPEPPPPDAAKAGVTSRAPAEPVWPRDPTPYDWVAGGRVISRTLADPEILAVMQRQSEVRRADPVAFLEYYRRGGVLTKNGKLTARYRSKA